MNAWLKQHAAEWIYRALVAIGLLIIGWMNSKYASRGEVDDLAKRVTGIETAIKVMVESNKVNERQDKAIEDHEARLRVLERERK